MRSPIIWFGGKGPMAGKLLELLPPHRTYVEVFGGGASLLFAKEPSKAEVYNDVDEGLVSCFRVLAEPRKFRRLVRMLEATPYSRRLFEQCRRLWRSTQSDVLRAYRWFVVVRQCFAGRMASPTWGRTVTTSSGGMAGRVGTWLHVIAGLPEIHAGLIRVQIECIDWRRMLAGYDRPETLFYCDPPYVPETRKSGTYDHELTEADHVELVELLCGLRGMVLLSGYRHRVHDPLEAGGWQRFDFDVPCRAVGTTAASGLLGHGALRGHRRTESVWLNPAAQAALRARRNGRARP